MQILGRPTGVVYVGQNFVWVGHGLPGLIARTASVSGETGSRIFPTYFAVFIYFSFLPFQGE